MKKLLFLILALLMMSCGSGDQASKLEEEIKSKKDEIMALNTEIRDLEKELADLKNEDPEKYKTLVVAEQINYTPFRHYFEAHGSVESIAEAFISPEVNSQIKQIKVREGERVKQGQLLVVLNTSITENTIEEVKTSLQLATTVYEKQKRLWDQQIGSEMQYLQAKNNKEALESRLKTLEAQLEMSYIRSPINGIVDEIFNKEGELAIPGMHLMQIVNLSELYINAEISEAYLPSIKEGDMVSLSFPTYPDNEMEVPIWRVGNVINPQNRSFTIQLKISNRREELKPNTLAIIKINDFSTDAALVVPTIILKKDIKGTYMYIAVEDEDGYRAQKVYVKTGISYQDESIIVEGLEPGQLVITKGYNMVSDGTKIKLS
jgi:RND family efflux transporter MFP subunit